MADEWLILFELAMDMIDHAETVMGRKIAWTVGGGTMLHQMFSHRHSKDIDIFLNDPQVLLCLSPRTNDIAERVADAGSYQEASNFIKFITSHGEIDFIVAPQLTKPHATLRTLGSRTAMVETPTEIMAKKLLYRAAEFTARDIFDLAFLIEQDALGRLMVEESIYLPQLLVVMKRIAAHQSALRRAFDQIDVDQYRPTFDHCVAVIAYFVRKHE